MPMTFSDVIIIRIQSLIEQQNITINKLATLSGLTQSTLENIMNGKTKNPKLKTLYRISTGFDMTLSDFLNFKEMNETSFEDE
jgi:transcriptional regulator with XRE-family HTH domain